MKNLSSTATAAKQVKEVLKMNFPKIKFSVKSKSYSGGDSLNISWNFGPIQSEVDAVVKHWQDGKFNGMEDIYEYGVGTKYHNNNKGEQVETITAKYVLTDRNYAYAEDKNTYTESGKNDVEKFVCVLHYVDYNPKGTNMLSENYHDNAVTYASNILRNTQFPSDKIKIDGVVINDDVTSWGMYELHTRYNVLFTDLTK